MTTCDRRRPAAATVALAVAGFYVLFTALALGRHGWNPLWFVWIGERYANLDPNGRPGYDGQFVYYLARDGGDALPHLDNPPYRLQRILLPVTARLFSLGQPAWVPWVLLAENAAAIALTAYLLARWLGDQGLSAWYALTYALYVGTFMAYSRDLTEPLAFCLTVGGVVLWFQARPAWALVSLALATLAKETALLFVLGLACSALAQKKPRLALGVMLAALPLAVWEGYLLTQLGALPIAARPSLEYIPLGGIVPYLTLEPGRLSGLLFVGLPALVLLPVAAGFVWQERGRAPAAWWLLFNSLLVVLMPLDVYDHIMHAGRNAGGMVLAVLFLFPAIKPPWRALALSYWTLPTLIWLIPVLRWAPWLSSAH